jgi:hypothetical protein
LDANRVFPALRLDAHDLYLPPLFPLRCLRENHHAATLSRFICEKRQRLISLADLRAVRFLFAFLTLFLVHD